MKLIIVLMLAAGLSACGTYGSGGYHRGPAKAAGDTVTVCHKGKKTMELPRSALDAHLGHGDRRGRC